MAKRKSWHFYTFIISFSVVFSLYLLWAYTPLKKGVELRIIKSLKPYLGESFYINDFSLGLTSVSFYGVRAADDNSTFALEIDEIRIGFIREKLFTTELRPTHIIESVTMVNPAVTFFYYDTPRKTESKIQLNKVFEEILSNIRKFPEIDHVSIEDGEINLQLPWGQQVLPEQKKIPLLSKLGGRVTYIANTEEIESFNNNGIGSEVIMLDLKGEFLGTPNSSVNLNGNVDFTAAKFDAVLNLDECAFNSNYPFWKLDFLDIDNALLTGKVRIENHSFLTDSLFMFGNIHAKDIDLSIYNQHVTVPEGVFRLDGRSIILDSLDCAVEDGYGRFSGTVPDVFQPEADWKLSLRNVAAKYLKQSHEIFEYAYEGNISGEATFKGPFKFLDVEAELRCPELLFGVVPFNRVKTNLTYNTDDKILYLDYLRADFLKFRTQGDGVVHFKTDTLNFSLRSDINVPENYFSILNGLNRGKVLLDTELKGNFDKKFSGKFFYQAVDENDSLFVRGQGPFTLDDQFFNFNLYSDDLSDNLTVRGTIEKVFSDPDIKILDVKDFPAEQLTDYSLIADFLAKRHVDYYFAGPYHSLSARMKVVPEKDPFNNIIDVTAHLKDLFFDNQRFRGKFAVDTAPEKVNGKFDIAFFLDGVDTKIEAPGLLNTHFFYGFRPDAPLDGRINIPGVSIKDYLQNSQEIAEVFENGIVEGDVKMSGTMQDPEIDFDLALEEFIVNGVGYYNSHISGNLQDDRLDFDNLWMRLNSDSVISAKFSWDARTDSMQLKVHSEKLESNFLAETITGDPNVIQGTVSYSMIADGVMDRPHIYGNLEFKNGLLKGNPFHTIYLSVEDSLFPGTSFWNLNSHVLKVRDFIFDNPDTYQFNGKGIISVDEYRPLDFQVDIKGNVLAELPKVQPYFLNAESNGRVRAHIQGTRVSPTFKELHLEVYDGALEFDGILPRLENLKVDVQLADEGNFVHIKTIEGLLDGRWAKISNVPDVKTESKEILPWLLEDPDLNFGVLVLETEERGIPMSIPGLMEDGDVGYFAARGQTPDEQFYFGRYASPNDSGTGRILTNGNVIQGLISPFATNNTVEDTVAADSTAADGSSENVVAQSLVLPDRRRPTPAGTPMIRGEAVLNDCRVTFPFIGMYEEYSEYDNHAGVDFLMNMEWDLKAVPGNNNRYFVNIPAYVSDVSMDLNIDNTSPGLHFTGRLIDEQAFEKNESTLMVTGGIRSVRGQVEYLDVSFRVEEFGAEFKGFEIYPEIYGTAYTTVRTEVLEQIPNPGQAVTSTPVSGSPSVPRDIYLQLYVTDPVTGKEVSKGRWEDFRFKLVSRDNVIGETQEQILSYLGYSFENLQYKAGEVGLSMTDNILIRPLFRPIERQLERRLQLDYIRLRTHFASNLFYMSFQGRAEFFNKPTFANPNYNLDSALLLLQSSEVTMGKYLLEDIYFTYKAELVAGYEESKLGVNHTWGLEYRLLYNLLFEVELTKFQFNPFYSEIINDDVRVRLRHSFNF